MNVNDSHLPWLSRRLSKPSSLRVAGLTWITPCWRVTPWGTASIRWITHLIKTLSEIKVNVSTFKKIKKALLHASLNY